MNDGKVVDATSTPSGAVTKDKGSSKASESTKEVSQSGKNEEEKLSTQVDKKVKLATSVSAILIRKSIGWWRSVGIV